MKRRFGDCWRRVVWGRRCVVSFCEDLILNKTIFKLSKERNFIEDNSSSNYVKAVEML
jgi:hypothetical protein